MLQEHLLKKKIIHILVINISYANRILAFVGFDEKSKRTKNNHSDINMFLSCFVLCRDSISARMNSQAHRNCYNRGSISRFHLITIETEGEKKTFIIIICVQGGKQGSDHMVSHNTVS